MIETKYRERKGAKMKVMMMAVVALGLVACNEEKVISLETDAQKLSYAMGVDVGNSLKSLEADIDSEILALAITDVLGGHDLRLEQEESTAIKQTFFEKKQQAQLAERNVAAEKNKKDGEDFLAENANKAGVTVTESGLQYEVLLQGGGVKPAATDKVKVHYKGTLLDGTEFDSSYSRGEPVVFPLNAVIKGWSEGVALMAVGSKYKFYIPSALAYGERGAGPNIAPHATLVFEVELLSIEQ